MAELLRVQGLTKRFRGLVANENIDFSLSAGSLRCVIGPNGAGKSTLVGLISGHQRPTAGRIWFKDREITGLSVVQRSWMGIGRKFQTPSIFPSLTVFQNLELAALGKPHTAAKAREKVREVSEAVRLDTLLNAPAAALSHGEQQWLEIGMLLANETELMLLDEPTAGMTAEETHAMGKLVRTLVDTLGLSAIVVEHDINFIRDLGAPVTVLHLGKVLVEGSFAEVAANEQVRGVYLGHA
jgi:branched-chain amino acid transport system ATP-binding protein/urea transport system ATP-binding protein